MSSQNQSPEACNDKAKQHYSRGEFQQAIELFGQAFQNYDERKHGLGLGTPAKYLLNRAAANAQLRYMENVVVDTTAALQLPLSDDLKIKALFRRADALSDLEQNLDVALADVTHIVGLSDAKRKVNSAYEAIYNKALSRQREISAVHRGEQAAAEAYNQPSENSSHSAGGQAASKGASEVDFSVTTMNSSLDLVHKYHSWRLTITNYMQETMSNERWCTGSIGIRNEFGLFQRGFLNPSDIILQGELLRGLSGLDTEPALRLEIAATSKIWGNLKCVTRCNYLDDLGDKLCQLDHKIKEKSGSHVPEFDEHGKCVFRYRLRRVEGKEIDKEKSLVVRILFSVDIKSISGTHGAVHSVLPVCTPPIQFITSDTSVQPGLSYRYLTTRYFGFNVAKLVKGEKDSSLGFIQIEEDHGNLGIGGRLWDSGMVLTKFLCKIPEICQNSRFLEIGSGTGIGGLAMGMICAKNQVSCEGILTDLEELVPFIKQQIELNNFAGEDNGGTVNLDATTLNWGVSDVKEIRWNNESSLVESPPSVIIGADIIYDHTSYQKLLDTFKKLTAAKVGDADKTGSNHKRIKYMLQHMLKEKSVSEDFVKSLENYSSSFCIIAYRTRHEDARKFWSSFCSSFNVIHVQRDDGELDRSGCHTDSRSSLQALDPDQVHRLLPDERIVSCMTPRTLKSKTVLPQGISKPVSKIINYSEQIAMSDVGIFFCWRKSK